MRLSVIIPTLNEADVLGLTLALLRSRAAGSPVEVIVADCGSADETVTIARSAGVGAQTGPTLTSRARACNAGAQMATGGALLFLHADSQVPQCYDQLIRDALATPGVIGGAFEFKLDGPEWRLRLVEMVNRARYRHQGRFFGDQGIFVLRDAFEVLGGFPDMPIMEDARFCRNARRVGKMRLISVPMLTSPRRFYGGGVLRTLAVDALIWLCDGLGLNLSAFADRYRRYNVHRAPPR